MVLTLSILLLNCSSPKENKTLKESDVSPGTAKIVGTISKIEPVSDTGNLSGPCSKVPCIALVKVSSAVYGSAFPQFVMGKEVRIKFLFTLENTTKELFPNMEEEYPGLKVGDEFTAVVSLSKKLDETAPKFQVHGYETN
jgi:hypothetical protein